MSHAAPAKPAPTAPSAPAGSAPTGGGGNNDPIVVTAERMFIELCTRAVKMDANGLQVATPAVGIAKLAFELSLAFHDVEVGRRVKAVPTSATFDAATMCDFDSWGAAAATPATPSA